MAWIRARPSWLNKMLGCIQVVAKIGSFLEEWSYRRGLVRNPWLLLRRVLAAWGFHKLFCNLALGVGRSALLETPIPGIGFRNLSTDSSAHHSEKTPKNFSSIFVQISPQILVAILHRFILWYCFFPNPRS
jgi:hypothetical protein